VSILFFKTNKSIYINRRKHNVQIIANRRGAYILGFWECPCSIKSHIIYFNLILTGNLRTSNIDLELELVLKQTKLGVKLRFIGFGYSTFFFFFFWDRIHYCSPGWLQTWDPPASVLGFTGCVQLHKAHYFLNTTVVDVNRYFISLTPYTKHLIKGSSTK
jgi:hypothetical protein